MTDSESHVESLDQQNRIFIDLFHAIITLTKSINLNVKSETSEQVIYPQSLHAAGSNSQSSDYIIQETTE